MKKAVISVLVGTAVLAFVACGKNAATETVPIRVFQRYRHPRRWKMDRKQPV